MSDDSFGYDYDDNDGYGDDGDDGDIEIENTFYEAEDKKNTNPKEALEGFESVIMLEENKDDKQWTFKALLSIILIKCKQEMYEGLESNVSQILKTMDKVSKNDANDAINEILEVMLGLKDEEKSQASIEKILDFLKEKNYE
mmetsp:Transcript_33390/g.30381  ORF Transcript_33390/g.30381 Transcript_33390/m.30381 type:complete len:142 (+) Transcript_33390:47-472(+)